MEALLTILVKDTQVLACMTYGNGGVVVQNQPDQPNQAGALPDDEQCHIPVGSKLFQIAAISNGELEGVGRKARQPPKGAIKGLISVGLKKIRRKKSGDVTKNQVQGQEVGRMDLDQDQLQAQEAGKETQDQSQGYALVDPGQNHWDPGTGAALSSSNLTGHKE